MLGLVLWLAWRRREFGQPTRIPGGESIVTLDLTERPEGDELSRPGRILFCVD